MKDIINSFKSKNGWIRMVLAAVIFFAVALPFRQLLALLPGITEIRPANMIPPVLGLIWGPPAAFGISIGNLISDIVSGSNVFICITGFIANFFYAYLPYKLWYSFKVAENDVAPTLGSVKKILKYIYIIFLDSLVVTGMLSLIFESAGFSASRNSYVLLFFNNFDFTVLLGVPVLIIIEKFNLKYYVPKAQKTKTGSFIVFDVLLFAIAAIGFNWFLLSLITKSEVNQMFAFALLIISILLTCLLIFKPFNFNNILQKRNNRDIKITIKAKVTIGFLLLSVVFITFIGIIVVNSKADADALERWSYVYQIIGIAINIIFAMTIAFLWYVEKNIVNPIERLSDAAKAFAARPIGSDEILNPELIKIDTGDEISLLAGSFNSMMQDITNYMHDLKVITAEKERIGAELNVAAQIQADMLPSIFPAFPERSEFDIFASMQPAKEVGGDFYDFFLIDDDHLAIVIADVSGKGVPAALFMVITKTLIKNHAQSKEILADVFTNTNEQLCENNKEGMFVTGWIGVLEISTGKFTFVNAGHNYPLLKRANGEFEYLKSKPGFVLAGMEGVKYKQNEMQLEVGDVLYLYTDGVTEATDSNDELYGEKRLKDILDMNTNCSPMEILPVVKKDIDKFVGTAPQFDDITMLCIKYKGINKEGN
ncbi:MAG: SpoIIE family protein phosphatase [Oscillospiraceae bacterium]